MVLSPAIRHIVIDTCLARDGRVYQLHAVVVMPEHVHMLFTPLPGTDGGIYSIPEIMHGVKGESAHRINKALNRSGSVWQAESFDHIPRTEEQGTLEYIRQNPVRRGLARKPEDYPWLWVAAG
jgi:putative DNA methylase